MKHLFLLCGNGGGSSLLKHVITRCENVAFFAKEGDMIWETYGPSSHTMDQRKLPHQLLIHIFENPQHYQWGRIKQRWDNLWQKKDDDRVYFQKSTGDYTRWKLMIEEFDNVHFIIMPRNPFAHVEGLMRKCNWDISCKDMAQGWVNMFLKQMECHEEYDKTILFTFEQLCFEEDVVVEKIKSLMPPDLQDARIDDIVFQHNHREYSSPSYHGIAFNVGSINRLSRKDIYTIRKVLEPYQDKLEKVGYTI